MAKLRMFNDMQLAALICVQNGIEVVDSMDGSANWMMFATDAKKMLDAVDLERYEIDPERSDAAHGEQPTEKK